MSRQLKRALLVAALAIPLTAPVLAGTKIEQQECQTLPISPGEQRVLEQLHWHDAPSLAW
jgi:hypothetical protein